MQDRLVFLIGSPRSGSTLLARMLGAHRAIHSPGEPHLITPIAHLGFHARVDTAPYDPIITETAAKELVTALPQGEEDYLDALRAYTDTVYERLLAPSGRQLLLDKTPAYALVLDFLARLYPKARYVVLTRHPLAVRCSFAESFFDGDHAVAHQHNPLIERYVPAIARFIRESPVPLHHVRYETLVQDPEAEATRLCEFLGIPFEPGMVNYGEQGVAETARGLGDPMSVAREKRPTTKSLARWVRDLAGQPEAVTLCDQILARLSDEDLQTWGFDRRQIENELSSVDLEGQGRARRTRRLSRYTLERAIAVRLRRDIHKNAFGRLVRRIRWACDVLLR